VSGDEARTLVDGIAALASKLETVAHGVETIVQHGAPLAARVDDVERRLAAQAERLDAHDKRLGKLERSVKRWRWLGAMAFAVGMAVGAHLGAG
jgi:hypothetical protein